MSLKNWCYENPNDAAMRIETLESYVRHVRKESDKIQLLYQQHRLNPALNTNATIELDKLMDC